MAQEQVPGLERDGAALTGEELAAMAEIARGVAAEDPEYAERINRLGGYDVSPLGPPSKWVAVPVAIVGALLAVGVLVGAVVLDDGKADTSAPVSQVHTK